ncbi:MAG: hypothetical protein IJ155_04435 [Prevotella sp.]|nr:hypothetical protein [Prevotella sp.]
MKHKKFDITDSSHNGFVITAIYHAGQLVWEAVKSCFGKGWNNDLGWNNDDGWNND